MIDIVAAPASPRLYRPLKWGGPQASNASRRDPVTSRYNHYRVVKSYGRWAMMVNGVTHELCDTKTEAKLAAQQHVNTLHDKFFRV